MARTALSLGLMLWACVLVVLSGCEVRPHAQATGLGYVERVTAGARSEDKLPMLVAMHGLGDTPESFLELFRELDVPARVVAVRAPDRWHGGFSWYPIDDPVRKPALIRERAQRVSELGKQLASTRPTRGLPVVTGFSQGGVLSFALAAYHPSEISAALPIAGMLETRMPEPVAFAKPLPVLAFHGRSDPRIAFGQAERAVALLKSKGRRATLSAYEGVGHTISPRMQRDLFAALHETLDAAAHAGTP
jgi:phospholipase/carboxylesterase